MFEKISKREAEQSGTAWRASDAFTIFLKGHGLKLIREADGRDRLFQGDDERELMRELARLGQPKFDEACARYF